MLHVYNMFYLYINIICNHSNGHLFICEDNMLFSRVKISCFPAKAQLVHCISLVKLFIIKVLTVLAYVSICLTGKGGA